MLRGIAFLGRTLPNCKDIETLAGALTGQPIAHVSGMWPEETATLRTADRSYITVENPRHPDPMAEAIRWNICEGNLLQALGRARAVNRGDKNPVEVILLTNIALPLTIVPLDQPVVLKSLLRERLSENAALKEKVRIRLGLLAASFNLIPRMLNQTLILARKDDTVGQSAIA